jgi:beta-1,4-mannosyl-glycoprotein beta-1,4-N-acetylglucosaminyltransferase
MRNTILPGNLRTGDAGIPLLRDLEKGTLANAGWHCSSCFSTIGQFLNKMASFSHAWMNHESFRDRDRIASAIREGVDLWGRKENTFTRIDNNADLPTCLLEDRERFRYMLDRSGKTAGFSDYP